MSLDWARERGGGGSARSKEGQRGQVGLARADARRRLRSNGDRGPKGPWVSLGHARRGGEKFCTRYGDMLLIGRSDSVSYIFCKAWLAHLVLIYQESRFVIDVL